MLTGDEKFLTSYDKIVADVEPRLEQLRVGLRGLRCHLADVRNLHVLIGKRLADLSMLVTMQKTQGTAAAIALVKTSDGSDTGEAINDVLAQLRLPGRRRSTSRAEAHWSQSLTLTRWITVAGTIFNMLLVGVAARLVYMDMRRRTLLTAELRDQKLRLESEAEERTRELVELSTHLQSVSEREKASLARELHDELGGLLVGARMDISWVEQHLAEDDPDIKQRLQPRAAEPIRRRRPEAAHHRGTAADPAGRCGSVRRAALAAEGDLRQGRPRSASSPIRTKNQGSTPRPPSPCSASLKRPSRIS